MKAKTVNRLKWLTRWVEALCWFGIFGAFGKIDLDIWTAKDGFSLCAVYLIVAWIARTVRHEWLKRRRTYAARKGKYAETYFIQ